MGQALGMLRTEVTKVAGMARTRGSYLRLSGTRTLGLFEKFRELLGFRYRVQPGVTL